jgi:GH15 family glucan-1,4-alpha-glucosidase
MSQVADFPPATLREHALIADGERGALCGPHGDLVWMCAPRWHDDAVFAKLIGGEGVYAVTPRDRYVWGGHYEHGLIWRNRWVTDTGSIIECRDALALPADPHRLVVLRRIEAHQGVARVRVVLDARTHFGREGMQVQSSGADHAWTARTGPLRLRWTGARGAHVDQAERLCLDLALDGGTHHDFVLEISDQALGAPIDPDQAWQATSRAWRSAIPALDSSIAARDARHAYAVMHGLTSRDHGMVAAATMSLPERAGTSTNYDYRYAWIRDQCFAGLAVAADGGHPLLADAVTFVTARLLADGDRLTPAYLVSGGPVPSEQPLDLPGYPGGADIRGNHVGNQFQLDAFGESLLLLAAAARRDMLDSDGWAAARVAAEVIEQRWDKPDAGIWELGDQWWTHSRLSCIAGLHQAAAVGPRGDAKRFAELADRIYRETVRRCGGRGHWQRTDTDQRVDAALLLPPIRDVQADLDPLTAKTVEAVRSTLVDDGYVYRYARPDEPLGQSEGAFLLCGFSLALAEQHVGNRVEAFRWFERNRAACGPAGLLAEEFDVEQRQLRGNLPQAFVHAMLLEAAVRLAE